MLILSEWQTLVQFFMHAAAATARLYHPVIQWLSSAQKTRARGRRTDGREEPRKFQDCSSRRWRKSIRGRSSRRECVVPSFPLAWVGRSPRRREGRTTPRAVSLLGAAEADESRKGKVRETTAERKSEKTIITAAPPAFPQHFYAGTSERTGRQMDCDVFVCSCG